MAILASSCPPTLEEATPDRRASDVDTLRDGFVGRRVISGTGETLGVVTGVACDRFGHAKHLQFVEPDGATERHVPLQFVRRVVGGDIHLAGPREGYHIARLTS